MPTYEYQCEECGHSLEAFQKITATPLKKCPKCSKDSLRRLISGRMTTLRFIGDGFYVNDYKDSKKEKPCSSCSSSSCDNCK